MNAVGIRHMFWQAPQRPFMMNGPLRTVPLRTSGRPLLSGNFFLAQATGNRLNGLSIPAIVGRIQIQPVIADYLKNPPQKPQDQYGGQGSRFGMRAQMQSPTLPKFPPMTDAEKQTLLEISQNPTDEELKDLAMIDQDLGPAVGSQGFVTTDDVCFYASQPPRQPSYGGGGGGFGRFERAYQLAPGLQELIDYRVPPPPLPGQFGGGGGGFGRFQRQEQPKGPDTSFLKSKFYCTIEHTDKETPYTRSQGNPFASWFGIDLMKTWGEEKQAVENGGIMLEQWHSFPFPPPIDTSPMTLFATLTPDLPKIAHVGARIDPEAFRAWLTIKTLENYNDVSDKIIAEAKREAKKKKRAAIIKAIGLSLAGIALAFILPAVIAVAVAAIKIAVEAYMDAKERRKAAKAMMDAAKMFEADAPAFSKEVQKTSDILDSSSAAEEASKPLTPEQLDAIKEVQAETPPTGTPAGTYVVGGVAATGLIAALVSLLR